VFHTLNAHFMRTVLYGTTLVCPLQRTVIVQVFVAPVFNFFSLLLMCYVFVPTCTQCHVKVPPYVKNLVHALVILVVIMLEVK